MSYVLECDERARLDFGRGVLLRHIADNTYEQVSLDGQHIRYLVAQEIVYANTLEFQRRISDGR